jgi:hypothetical protein
MGTGELGGWWWRLAFGLVGLGACSDQEEDESDMETVVQSLTASPADPVALLQEIGPQRDHRDVEQRRPSTAPARGLHRRAGRPGPDQRHGRQRHHLRRRRRRRDLGGDGDDQIFGGSGQDNIQGGNGNDRLFGEDGDDVIAGDAGNDCCRAARDRIACSAARATTC